MVTQNQLTKLVESTYYGCSIDNLKYIAMIDLYACLARRWPDNLYLLSWVEEGVYLFMWIAVFLQWYKTTNSSAILSTQATYSVQAATVAISGVYVCRASNRRSPAPQGIVTVTVSPTPTTTAAQTTTEPLTTTMATTEEVCNYMMLHMI